MVITCIMHKLTTALENQKALAGTDPLTSVANRRAFYDLANLELNKARRYQIPISFLYLDIDNFKKINDNFGRPTITRADQLKPKPDESNLGFGVHFTDHMFNMDYTPEKGWYNPHLWGEERWKEHLEAEAIADTLGD